MAVVQKKVTRKELLKEPDQFITFSGRLIAFGQRYRRQLTYAGMSVLALLVVFTAARYFIARSENRAFVLLDQYSAQYRQALSAKGAEPAMEMVRQGFETLIDDYGSRTAGHLARIRYGDICYAAGRYERAVALYTQALSDFSDEPFYRVLILNSLGYATWQNGDSAQAITFFQQVAETADAPMKDQALFALADLNAGLGKSEPSRDALRKLLDGFPDSDYARVAREAFPGA